MRFHVLGALLVATIVASCSPVVNAVTKAVDDNISNNNQVARLLRKDDGAEEERGGGEKALTETVAGLDKYIAESKGLQNGEVEIAEKIKGLLQNQKGAAKQFQKAGIDFAAVSARDKEAIQKLTEVAFKSLKGKENWGLRAIKGAFIAFGVIGVIYVIYRIAMRPAPNTTPDSTAKSGKTTVTSA